MEDTVTITILKELREFKEENNRRWEQNEKCWEENARRWEQNEKRWEENDRRWEQNEKRWEKNSQTLIEINERIIELEEGRKKDRKDILEILDTMQKVVDNQFTEMKGYFDAKFDKIFATQRLSDIEEEQFRKIVNIHDKRLNFYQARLEYIEEWKGQFDLGEYTIV